MSNTAMTQNSNGMRKQTAVLQAQNLVIKNLVYGKGSNRWTKQNWKKYQLCKLTKCSARIISHMG